MGTLNDRRADIAPILYEINNNSNRNIHRISLKSKSFKNKKYVVILRSEI